MKRLFWSILGFFGLAVSLTAQRLDLSWPTPNPAFEQGKSGAVIFQDTGTGDPSSGGFGGVRSSGRQFHEGIDIKAMARDRRGESTDLVFAAIDGVVAYVNPKVGDSNYGRYVVLEHPAQSPAIYTLYAHLASVAPGIRTGAVVQHGQTLGVMGRSSSGRPIPRERAHLHFEMGLWVTRDFQSWYNWKKFGSPNEHGVYNGMNLMGFDPMDFFQARRTGRINTMQDYFTQMRPVVRLRIATSKMPDFVQRYPVLVTRSLPMLVAGWEIECNWTGLPFRWTPLGAKDVAGMRHNEVRILYVDEGVERREKSKNLVASRHGNWVPGNDLTTVLQLLFGLR
ncbi:MAG: M23 family metallopeptidase [Cephaloticoccus sp.]|nr:M23 family metallopeptidase [Cephaloticoccus sp.]MCF7760523.1 M23 family metallopeptidase [Cephaloticoccus sp.]